MNVKIEIECEDEQEVIAHLQVLAKQIKVEVKRQAGMITKRTTFTDSNCYGVHQCVIKP